MRVAWLAVALVAWGCDRGGERVEVDPVFQAIQSLPAEDGGQVRAARKGRVTRAGQELCWSEVGLRHPAAPDLDLVLLRDDCPLWREKHTAIRWEEGVGTLRYEDDRGYALALEARVAAPDVAESPAVPVSPDGTRQVSVTTAEHHHRHLPAEVTRVEVRRHDDGELTALEVPGQASVHWRAPHTLVLRQGAWTVSLVEG